MLTDLNLVTTFTYPLLELEAAGRLDPSDRMK
jgi:hypothetical protein